MSGSLVGGFIGAAVGFMIGMPQVGYMIGSMIGGYLTQPDKQGPRLTDLTPQTSEYGRPIPIVYGTVGIQGNVIWATKLVEHSSTSGGGKGGGPSTTTYSYTGSVAVAFAEGVKQIGRIWAGPDKTLVWDGKSFFGEGTIRIYNGTEDQMPDPAMEADKGVGNVPAYRGTVYVVIENMALAPYGNAYPFLTAEVGDFAANAVGTPTTTATPMVFSPLRTAYGTNADSGMYPLLYVGGKLWQANMQNGVTPDTNWTTTPAGSISIIDPTSMTVVGTTKNEPGLQTWRAMVYAQNTDTVFAIDGIGSMVMAFDGTTGEFVGEAQLPHYLNNPLANRPRPTCLAVDPVNGSLWVGDEAGQIYHWSLRTLGTPNAIGDLSGGTWGSDAFQYSIASMAVANDSNCYIAAAAYGWKCTTAMVFTAIGMGSGVPDGVAFNPNTNVIYFHTTIVDPNGGAYGGNVTVKWDVATQTALTQSPQDYGTFHQLVYDTANNILWELIGATVRQRDPDTLVIYNALLIDNTPTEIAVNVPSSTAGSACCYAALYNSDIREVCFTAAGTAGYIPATVSTTLQAIINDLSQKADVDLSLVQSTALTDSVDGYVIASQTTVRQAIDTLRPVYYFDAIESMGVIKFVKRGGPIALVVNDLALGTKVQGENTKDLLNVDRKMEHELPKTVTVGYLLAAKQYDHATKVAQRQLGSSQDQTTIELPLTLTDTKAMEVAQANLYALWSGRNTFSLPLPPSLQWLEPTDIIQVFDFVMRITKITDQNGYLQVEAQSEDIQAYAQQVVVTETVQVVTTPTSASLTTLEVM